MEKEELKNQIAEYLEKAEAYGNPKLAELGMSVRTFHCLYLYGMRNLADLIGKSKDELIGIRNLGGKSVDEVLKIAEMYGLSTENDVISGTIDEEVVEKIQEEAEVISTPIADMGFNSKTLKYLGNAVTLADVIKSIHRNKYWTVEHKDVFQDIVGVLAKFGYSLNKTGYFVFDDPCQEDSILLKTLKEKGLEEALALCEQKHFAEKSSSMSKISRDVEKYLNWLVEEKLANTDAEHFERIEQELDTIRESFKKHVEIQRALLSDAQSRKAFASKMAVKNAEVRRYHHIPNPRHEEHHKHNPFVENEREL